MERRTILGLGVLVWIAGFLRGSNVGVVRRTFGSLVATVLLLLLAGPAPKIAVGMAWVMAVVAIAADADSIAATLNRALTPPWQTVSVPNLTQH